MGFKEDGDFARFVAMGAVGTSVAADVLRGRFGHQPIELERYAMANKVWQSKVKRFRLPDLLCVRCGVRVEAKAKSKLGIVLSHSDTPGRRWDDGGMRDSDLFAFMRVESPPGAFPPEVAEPEWFSTAALRASVRHARRSNPKAASEGSEVTMTWPCWVPRYGGTFKGVDDQDRIVVIDDAGKQRLYWHWRKWAGTRFRYLLPGDTFEPDSRIVAGIAEPPQSLMCPGLVWDVAAALYDADAVERLAAVKATGILRRGGAVELLNQVAQDEREDWRVRLEANVALTRNDPQRWVPQVAATINVTDDREQHMEAVLALTEVPALEAVHALCDIAGRDDLHEDVRAAAAWGVGQGAYASPERLLPIMLYANPLVAVHAVGAIDTVSDATRETLLGWLSSRSQRRAATAANVLARSRSVDTLLDAYELGEPAQKWAIYALGKMEAAVVRVRAGARLTGSLRAVLELIWLRELDWLSVDDDPLAALDLQKIRFDPMQPTLQSTFGVGPLPPAIPGAHVETPS